MVNTPKLFDRKLLALRRKRAAQNFNRHDFLFTWAAENIEDRLTDINRTFTKTIQIGNRGPNIALGKNVETPPSSTKKINTTAQHPPRVELYKIMQRESGNYSSDSPQQNTAIIADEEFLPFKNQSLDLVTSNLNLHTCNDLPGTLIQIRRALKPDGLFIASMFGGETLHELRTSLMNTEISKKGGASPRIFPFADKQQMGGLLQRAGFALPVVDSELITVTYPNMFKLMHDLRGMGESNIITERSKTYPGRDFFAQSAQHYAQNFAEEDGRIFATFEIIFLIGWAPHESQQKPLKPGSAEHSLAIALGTTEIKTGENP